MTEDSWLNQKNLAIECLMAKTACALQSAKEGDFNSADALLHERALLLRELELLEKKAELKDLLAAFPLFEIWTKELETLKNADRQIAMSISLRQEELKKDFKQMGSLKRDTLQNEGLTGKGLNLEVRG